MAEQAWILMSTSLQTVVYRQFRRELLLRGGGVCGICKQPLTEAEVTVDHVFPQALGGTHELNNLQPAHRVCNARKNDRHPSKPKPTKIVGQHQADPVVRGISAVRHGNELSVGEVARYMHVHPETVRRWVRSEGLRALRPGGGRGPLKIVVHDLDDWLAQRPATQE